MRNLFRPVLLVSGALLALFLVNQAWAQNSLGIGSPEQVIKPEGPFAGILFWIQQQQKEFYKALTGALKAIREEGTGGLWLVGLSFAYGVFHAAGPGHGKAVISSYMIANEVALRRGILLSFTSAFLQAVTAVVAIGSLFLFLRGAGYKSADLTRFFEIASYGAITLLGAWLLYSKLFKKPLKQHHGHADHSHDDDHHHSHDHIQGASHDHGHPDHVCGAGCGHSHAPDPQLLSGAFGWSEARSAVLAVGLRPCSGALIVLTFAFFNGLYAAGIGSAFAMALGTGLTVSILATLAVTAKNLALKISGAESGSATFYRIVEITGASLVFFLGATLLLASLQ